MSNDYFMRQIEDMTRALASFIFMQRPDSNSLITEEGTVSAGNLLAYRLRQLVQQGHINQAEDLLFETVRTQRLPEYMPVALDFYTQLQGMSNGQLAAGGFSRQELAEGLADITKLFEEDMPGGWTDE